MGVQPIKTWSLMKQSLRNRFGVKNHEGQRQGQSKVKFMESLMVEESSKIKELSQPKFEENLKIHVVDKTSKEPSCIMNEKSIEIKENERVEEKERLVERTCIFDSISIFSKESEHLECSKEKVSLRKSLKIQERMKEENLPTRSEDKGRDKEEERGNLFKDLPISLSLNPSLINKKLHANLGNYDFWVENGTFLGVLSFQGFQVGEIMEEAIRDWFISKIAFEEESFHGFTSFYKKFIKDSCTIASRLMDVSKKKTIFPWKLCLLLVEIASNQAYYSPILYSSFEVDFCDNLLMSFDLTPLFVDHALSLAKVKKMEFVKLRTNIFKGGVEDINRESEEPKDLLNGLSTSMRLKKLKALVDNGMIVYMTEALKSKVDEFEDQGKHSKTYPTIDGRVALTVAGRLLRMGARRSPTYHARGESTKLGKATPILHTLKKNLDSQATPTMELAPQGRNRIWEIRLGLLN
ncbi:hypothetical protein M9H77_06985 [Catharanthus roseus]|uniref:Uncharacterized protein n=1 Tax=Catharanthus roseus TaxID=4058 RepID=A0ACC0BTT5_CATRO|nr:hypothetical protein M9H77_06985 [Catharanthus roseus]